MSSDDLTERADQMMKLGETRLQPLIQSLSEKNILKEQYFDEKKQWNLFYDEIEDLMTQLVKKENRGCEKRDRLKESLLSCRVTC